MSKDLFHSLSGFAWNPETKLFEAELAVWEQLIQEKPEARKWRTTSIYHYDKLYQLYGTQRATSEYAESAREKVNRWQRDGSSSTFDLNDSLENFFSDTKGIFGEGWRSNEGTPMEVQNSEYAPSINSQGTTSSKGTKCMASMLELFDQHYEKLSTGIDRVSDVLATGNIIAQESVSIARESVNIARESNEIAKESLSILQHGRPDVYKPEEVYPELEVIDLNGDNLMDAYFYLSSNATAIRSFFGVPQARRLEWLMRAMGSSR